ncbi:MAG: hypothetical protein V2I62_03885 [Bacteroidales bacterium]|jgi:hypothetical protein|nr:hypothetical protein [Bacteroidales bacterium]
MGFYSEYLDKHLNFDQITQERKKHLKRISRIRGGRDILVYASDLTKSNASISIDYSDLLPFQDQLVNLEGEQIDIILETPGGFAEVVEDLVKLVRNKYEKVGIIIPGYAKSAGTIFAMAGDEILMGPMSALGPIDAQIVANNKRFSAEAFLEGLEKIKEEVIKEGKLNPAYIPILQNISPGEIQHCENAQNFSKKLVTDWLSRYKFKYWDRHSTTSKPVTGKQKQKRANEIARILCQQSKWLTHGRSIKIDDFKKLRLKITDFSAEKELNESILRYYTLLRMSFETTIYKIFETVESQIYRFAVTPGQRPPEGQQGKFAEIKFECPKCKENFLIQVNLEKNVDLLNGRIPYPVGNDIFKCPNCKAESNISTIRLQIEAQSGKKIVK